MYFKIPIWIIRNTVKIISGDFRVELHIYSVILEEEQAPKKLTKTTNMINPEL